MIFTNDIRLVAIDVDGTLVGEDLTIHEPVREAVRAVAQQGVVVTLATGRMVVATMPFALQLELNTPLICYQGAMVYEPASGEKLYEQPVPLELARQVIERVQPLGHHVNVYLDDTIYAERQTPGGEYYARIAGVPIHAVGDLLDFLHAPPTKIVIVSDEPTTIDLVADLRHAFKSKLHVTRSYPIFCELVHVDVSKAKALARLAAKLGIQREQVMAIGDNLNDFEMVSYAGLGVAMENGSPEVKAAAQYVAPSVDEHGVATALERYILNGAGARG